MSIKNKIGGSDHFFWFLILLLILLIILTIFDKSIWHFAWIVLSHMGCPPGSDPMCI
jgi:hypothetical protein